MTEQRAQASSPSARPVSAERTTSATSASAGCTGLDARRGALNQGFSWTLRGCVARTSQMSVKTAVCADVPSGAPRTVLYAGSADRDRGFSLAAQVGFETPTFPSAVTPLWARQFFRAPSWCYAAIPAGALLVPAVGCTTQDGRRTGRNQSRGRLLGRRSVRAGCAMRVTQHRPGPPRTTPTCPVSDRAERSSDASGAFASTPSCALLPVSVKTNLPYVFGRSSSSPTATTVRCWSGATRTPTG